MRYHEQNDDGFDLIRFAIVCWAMLLLSLMTFILCIVAPFSEKYRTKRADWWQGLFFVWIVVVIVTPGAFAWYRNAEQVCGV